MKHHGIGLREIVALGALGFAAFIGYLFLDPASTDGDTAPRPTPTPSRVVVAAGLSPWELTFVERRSSGDIVDGTLTAPELDLEYDGAPFPDMKDDAWAVFAAATFNGPPGRYLLSVTYTGEIGVTLAGETRKVSPPVGDATLRIPFEHGTGPTAIQLRLGDVSGPARLHATVVVHP